MSEPGSQERPSEVLRAEHRTILKTLGVLARLVERSSRGEGFEIEELERCVEFFRLFADACHHAKEEDLLFPALESRGVPREGGPIGVMLWEHQMARKYTREMGAELEAYGEGDREAEARFRDRAGEYLALLEQHIFKEDNVLFTMGDRVLTGDDQKTLAASFCAVGCRAFEGRTRHQLERLAGELEARWPPS